MCTSGCGTLTASTFSRLSSVGRSGIGAVPQYIWPSLSTTRPVHSRSEEHTSELQSLMRISYAVFCLKKKKNKQNKRCTYYIQKYAREKRMKEEKATIQYEVIATKNKSGDIMKS